MGDTTLKIHVDVTDALNGTAKLGTGIENLNAEAQKFGTRSKQAFMSTKDAAKALNQGVNKLEDNLKLLTAEYVRLGQIGSKMNKEEVLRWKKLNKEIENTKNQITLLKSKQADLGGITSKGIGLFKKLGAAIGAAFTVGALISFTKASVAAYQEQLRAESKLKTSMKGREDAVNALILQANELQAITLFDDEQIINAQALLSIFIKDEKQLKTLTPLVLDLAQAKGMDLSSAADLVAKSIGSGTNALKRYGIEITGAVGSTERAESAVTALSKAFKDQAVNALTAEEKALRSMQVSMNETKEAWGKLTLTLMSTVFSDDTSPTGRLTKNLNFRAWELKKMAEESGSLGERIRKNFRWLFTSLRSDWDALQMEEMANIMNAGAKTLMDVAAVKTPGGYPEPGANVVDDGRRNYEYDTTQYLIKLREELVDKYGNLLDEQNKDLLKALDDELKWRQERDDKALKAYEDMLKKMREADKEFAKDVRLDPMLTGEKPLEQNVTLFGESVKIYWDNEVGAWQIAQEEIKDVEIKMRDDFKKFNEDIKKEQEQAVSWAEENPFWASLGFTDQKQLDQMADYADEMLSFVNEIVDQSVEASERLVDDWNQRIDEQEQLVEREQEDKAEGLANNYELEQENLANMQKARDQAIKDREKNIQIQRTLSTIESGIALVTAAANIMKGFSEIPIVGVILGLLAVGAMITGFILAQSQISDATKMEKGGLAHGLLKGKRHSEGGIAIEAEEGEYFTNRNSTKKYLPLLEAINKDDREGMKLFFDRKFVNKMPQQKLSFDIDSSKKLEEIARNTRNKKGEIFYGDGFIIERNGGYTKKINLN